MTLTKEELRSTPLESILERFGANSEEFYLKVIAFIRSVVRRYYYRLRDGERMSDAVSSAYAKVLRVLTDTPYDPAQGNLRTYIYTVTRNEISTLNYRENRQSRSEVAIDAFLDPEESPLNNSDAPRVRRLRHRLEHRQSVEMSTRPVLMEDPVGRQIGEDSWRTVLGAYVHEAEGVLRRLARGEMADVDLDRYSDRYVVEAVRVHLWRCTSGGTVL